MFRVFDDGVGFRYVLPEHTAILPFTRMLAGPIDFTPGVFDLGFERWADQRVLWQPIDGVDQPGRMSTTLAKQLALYVVIYSPLQMACDLPENYEGHPGLQFVRDVAVDWEQTRVIDGEVGDYVTIARQAKGSPDWFLGSLTDDSPRMLQVSLDFLDPDRRYRATIYRDGAGAHYRDNPGALEVEQRLVSAHDALTLALAPGGGQAVSLRAVPERYPYHPKPAESP